MVVSTCTSTRQHGSAAMRDTFHSGPVRSEGGRPQCANMQRPLRTTTVSTMDEEGHGEWRRASAPKPSIDQRHTRYSISTHIT
jgi:hypothetical protein